MTEPNTSNQEVLLVELEFHKAEFVALRDEIVHISDGERQLLNLTLVAVGVGLGLTPFILGQNGFVILLLFPLVFHIILWEMLNSARGVSLISGYLTSKLIPRVNAILQKLGNSDHNTLALGWEVYISTLPIKAQEIILITFTPTRHWMPILAIAGLIVTYVLAIKSYGHSPSSLEIGLVFLNLLLLIWAAVRNTIAARASMQYAHKLKQDIGRMDEQIQLQTEKRQEK